MLTESEIIELAWADDVSFDTILFQTGLSEKDVICLMRRELKPSSFRLWRKRVTGRRKKHGRLIEEQQSSLKPFRVSQGLLR